MTTTRLNDLFDKLEPEKGNKLDDKIQIEGDDLDFEHLTNILKEAVQMAIEQDMVNYLRNKITNKYTSNQITKLSLMLNNENLSILKQLRLSMFLNFLINNSEDKTHNIHTSHLKNKLSCLGESLNGKKLHIHGDAGEHFGTYLVDSEIIVNGNALSYAGAVMRSGKIIIKGSCGRSAGANMEDGLIDILEDSGDEIGFHMDGGKIIIRGNTGKILGHRMRRGVIEVYGEIESLGNATGGNIYHKGKQIVRNGEILDESYKVE